MNKKTTAPSFIYGTGGAGGAERLFLCRCLFSVYGSSLSLFFLFSFSIEQYPNIVRTRSKPRRNRIAAHSAVGHPEKTSVC